jgi:hypothetical protein
MIPTRIRRAARWLAVAAVIPTVTANAHAFFFKGWPGDGRAKPQSLLKPGTPDEGGRPPGAGDGPNPGDDTSSPGSGGPIVPEPGAVVMAAVGIGVVAIVRRCRRSRAW